MRLFEVTNGYMGESYIRLLVICDTLKRAKDIARPLYKEKYEDNPYKSTKYWENIEVTELCDDVSKEWCNEITDG